MIFDKDVTQQNSVKELMDELLDKDIIPQREIVKMKRDVVIHTNPNLIMDLRHEERKERRKSLTQNKDEILNISDKNLIKKDTNKIKETLLINNEIKKIEQQFETDNRKLISNIKKSSKNKKFTNKSKIKSCTKHKSKIENEEKIKGTINCTEELQNVNITTQIYQMPDDIKEIGINSKLNDIENDLMNLSEINKYLNNLDDFDEENLNISDDKFADTVAISNGHFKSQGSKLENNKNEIQDKYSPNKYDSSIDVSQNKHLEIHSDNLIKDNINNFKENDENNYTEKCIINNHLSQNCAEKCENIEINYSNCHINDEEVSGDYNIITRKNLSSNTNHDLSIQSISINDTSIEVLDVKPLTKISKNIVINKPVKRDKKYINNPTNDDIFKHYCDEVMECSIHSNDIEYNQNDDILNSSISRKMEGLIEEINNSNFTIKPKSLNRENFNKNEHKYCTEKNKILIKREKYLLKKFWNKWSEKIKINKKDEIIVKNTVDDKFDNFLSNLEKRIAERKLNFNNKMILSPNKDEKQKQSSIVKGSNSSEVYKNRFKAQKDIIEQQKLLLEEQNKKIKLLEEEESKIKHINKDDKDIKMPTKVKRKKKKVENNDLLKTPKFVENMNKRAEERSKKRQELKLKKEEEDLKLKIQQEEEKKRIIEEKKYAAIQAEQMEYLKKILEEENRKKEIEFIKNAESKVKALYRKILLTYYMNLWKKVLILRKENFAKADLFYKTNLMKKSFQALKEHAESSKEEKMKKAELLRICELQRKYWDIWYQKWKENRDMRQVAEDYNDMRLSYRVLIALLWNKVQNRKRDDELLQLADRFYRRQLLSKAFQSLRNFPKIMFKEREKEKRLRSWEDKVKEVIPDFSIT